MPTHLTFKKEHQPNPRTATPEKILVIVAGDMICFVVGNIELSWGETLCEEGSVKQTILFIHFLQGPPFAGRAST